MAASRRRSLDLEESLEERLDRDGSGDLVDVPAAVVCALCGDADCSGCEESDLSRSGIVAIIAWERPHAPVLSRLWSTARASTRDAESFFELLPDGPITPALRFAATCELLAATAALLGFVAVAAVVAPSWLHHVAFDPAARSAALGALVLGLPAFAALLVLGHAAHGLAIDLGARRNGGARVARSRALRFGLYACGWDLVMGPLGAVVVAMKEGLRPALDLPNTLAGLGTRAAKAFLRGCYRLEGERARRALATAFLGASLAVLLFGLVLVAAVIALALA